MSYRISPLVKKIIPVFSIALLFQACADRSLQRFDKIAVNASKDDYPKAIEQVRDSKKLYGSENALLYYMDLGLLHHYAGHFDSSIVSLTQAVKAHDDLFAKSVTNEAASILVNDNVRPYRGKPYEIVLLHQFLAFNYLAQGKYDDALVEIRQTQMFLDEVKRKAGKDSKTYVDDGMFRYISALVYQAARQKDDAGISMYQAIKAYRQGKVQLPPSMLSQAATLLKATNREQDIQELGLGGTPLINGNESGSEIIVIGEAGRSPALGQNAFWGTYAKDGVLVIHYKNAKGEEVTTVLPAPGLPASELSKAAKGRKTRSGTTFHIKFSMPAIKEVRSQTQFFTVAGEASPNPVRTEPLTDLDPLLNQFLEDNHTAILLRTVVRVVLRTLAAEETKSAISGSNPLINLVLNIGTDVLSDQLEQADTRSWFLLPNTVQIARIPVTPGVHSLTIAAHDRAGNTLSSRLFDQVNVNPGEKKFVFYSSLK